MTINNPALGAIAGIAWGDKLNERDFQAERERLAKELAATNTNCYVRRAMADASMALLDAVTAELQAEQEGRLRALQPHADPQPGSAGP